MGGSVGSELAVFIAIFLHDHIGRERENHVGKGIGKGTSSGGSTDVTENDLNSLLLYSCHELLGSSCLLLLADTCSAKTLCGVTYSDDHCLHTIKVSACCCRIVGIGDCLKSLHDLLDHGSVCALTEGCDQYWCFKLYALCADGDHSVAAAGLILIVCCCFS